MVLPWVGLVLRSIRHAWTPLALFVWGCGSAAGDGGADAEGGTTSGGDELHCSQAVDDEGEAWLELGQGIVAYEPLVPGGELRIVLGGQGLLMFAIDLRAGGFCVPPDLSDRDEFPVLDIEIEIEGEPVPFIALNEQPIDFDILEDDTFIWVYLPMILPDAADPEQLVGKAVTVSAQLVPHDHAPLDVEVQMLVGVEG